jgi:hypothetical protein
MLLYLSPRTIDHSTEAIEMSAPPVFALTACCHSIQQAQQQQFRQKCPSPIKAGGRRKWHWRHATIARVIRIPIRSALVVARRAIGRFFSVSGLFALVAQAATYPRKNWIVS